MMGTDSNCSYTQSGGQVTWLVCSPSQCCDPSAGICSVSACVETTQSTDSSSDSINTYLFWVILASCTVFTLLVLLVSYAICRYRTPGCADAGEVRDRFILENVLDGNLIHWKELHPSPVPHATTSTTTVTTTTISTSSITSTSTAFSATSTAVPADSGSSSPAESLQLLMYKSFQQRLHLSGKKSLIPVRKPASTTFINTSFTTKAPDETSTVTQPANNVVRTPSVHNKSFAKAPDQILTRPQTGIEVVTAPPVKGQPQRAAVPRLGGTAQTLPRGPIPVTGFAAAGPRKTVVAGSVKRITPRSSVKKSDEVSTSRPGGTKGSVSTAMRKDGEDKGRTMSTCTPLSPREDSPNMTAVGT